MGLMEQEIKELRQMNTQFMQGKIAPETVKCRIAIYSQIQKRTNTMLQAFALASKYNKRTLNRIIKTNLIGDGQVIDLDARPEAEKIMCPYHDRIINREYCLDFSGSNMDKCSGCEHKKITQDAILGEV